MSRLGALQQLIQNLEAIGVAHAHDVWVGKRITAAADEEGLELPEWMRAQLDTPPLPAGIYRQQSSEAADHIVFWRFSATDPIDGLLVEMDKQH